MKEVVIGIVLVIIFQIIISVISDLYIITTLNKYNGSLDDLKTGDILLYSYNFPISDSQEIKLFTNSPWSHVSVIHKDGDKLNILESIGSISKSGTQINDVNTLYKYSGHIAVLKLNKRIPKKDIIIYKNKYEFPTQTELLTTYIERLLGIELLNQHNCKWMHCAEYVGKLLNTWKIIPSNISLRHLFPIDFCNINTINGYEYSEPLLLK